MNTEAKDVIIGERTFRLGRMTALVGSYILNVLTLATMKAQADSKPNENAPAAQEQFDEASPQERADSTVEIMWLAGGPTLSIEKYSQIQTQCLQLCALYPTGSDAAPIPIMNVQGRWAITELEKDIAVVNKLIQEALKFNLAPFFIGSASNVAATAAAPVMIPPLTRPATGTLPGRS